MDKLDMFLTVAFVIVTGIIFVLIYFYNTRHQLVIEDEVDEYEVETKKDKVVLKKDDTFEWDLYESDVHHSYDKFFGIDKWLKKETAVQRIDELKKEMENKKESLDLTLFEMMMFIEKSNADISLDEESIYRVSRYEMKRFVEELEYNQDLIELATRIKDEIDFNMENLEIDARKLFYVMRNAKSLGIYKVANNVQFFTIAKTRSDDEIASIKIA